MKQNITLFNLPSKGEHYPDPNYLLQLPLYTFNDILIYNNYPVPNYLHRILRDIDSLNIENVDDLLLFDLSAVSFLKKCMSIKEDINFDFPFKCEECGNKFVKKIKLTDIDFKTGIDLPNTIKIGTDEVATKIPTLKDVKTIARMFLGMNILPLEQVFLVCCYLDYLSNPTRIKYLVETAKQSDIVLLLNLIDNIDPILPTKIKCNRCEKETTVTLSALTVDLFSLFRINY
jgi:hypothetical protein